MEKMTSVLIVRVISIVNYLITVLLPSPLVPTGIKVFQRLRVQLNWIMMNGMLHWKMIIGITCKRFRVSVSKKLTDKLKSFETNGKNNL